MARLCSQYFLAAKLATGHDLGKRNLVTDAGDVDLGRTEGPETLLRVQTLVWLPFASALWTFVWALLGTFGPGGVAGPTATGSRLCRLCRMGYVVTILWVPWYVPLPLVV